MCFVVVFVDNNKFNFLKFGEEFLLYMLQFTKIVSCLLTLVFKRVHSLNVFFVIIIKFIIFLKKKEKILDKDQKIE
jgi:hypothetical protein